MAQIIKHVSESPQLLSLTTVINVINGEYIPVKSNSNLRDHEPGAMEIQNNSDDAAVGSRHEAFIVIIM